MNVSSHNSVRNPFLPHAAPFALRRKPTPEQMPEKPRHPARRKPGSDAFPQSPTTKARRRVHTLCICLTLTLLLPAQASDQANSASGNSLDTLDGLVKTWLELRTELSDERQSRTTQKLEIETETGLLEREKTELTTTLAVASQADSTAKSEQVAYVEKINALNRELDQFRRSLEIHEAALANWSPRIPESLRQPLAENFAALSRTRTDAGTTSLGARARVATALYAQIESMQNQFHPTRETIADDDHERRNVDVLYLGLSRAFAVSSGNDWALIGFPSETGWRWEKRTHLAQAFRLAFEVIARQKPAQLTSLPMGVEPIGK